MNERTGKPYESLVAVVFQSIVRQTQVNSLVLQHDVILEGSRGSTHQIDVFWKFEVGGLVYETVVQAKDWRKPIDQGEVLKFIAVLDDLPGRPKGIIVTRSGYQKSAKDHAVANGILMYELREADFPPALGMTSGGWAQFKLIQMPLQAVIVKTGQESEGRGIVALGFEVDVYHPRYTNLGVETAKSWLQAEYPESDTSGITRVDLPSPYFHEVGLYDSEGIKVGDLASVFQKLGMEMQKEGTTEARKTRVFDTPTFMRTGTAIIPRIRVDSVSIDIRIDHEHGVRRGRSPNFAQWVLHDLGTNNSIWFGVAPSVTALLPAKTGTT
jgi:hypothetical protein